MDSSSFSREVKVLGPNCSKTRELASSSCVCLFAWAYSRTFFGQCLLLLYVTCGYCDVWTPTITISTLLLPACRLLAGSNNLVRLRDVDSFLSAGLATQYPKCTVIPFTLHYQNQTKLSSHKTYVPEGLCTLTITTTVVTVTSPSQSRGAHTVSPAAAAM